MMSHNQPLLTAEAVWRRYDSIESRLTAPVSERMLDLAGLEPGMSVLDLATGRGEPALRAARRVGPKGVVVGVDLSDALLQIAREQAQREGLSNLDLRAADAEVLEGIPRNTFHAATVRWGLMYMTAPVVALSNVRRCLLPTGHLVAALWAEPERVPYFTLPRRLLERYRPMPALDPDAPGTFRYANLDRVGHDFNRAGFSLDHVEEMEVPVFEADSGAEIVMWVRAFGLTKLLSTLSVDDQSAWQQDLINEMERSRTGGIGGLMSLGGVTRIVRASLA